MGRRSRAPRVFHRVEDATSRGRICTKRGLSTSFKAAFRAESFDSIDNEYLLEMHLIWGKRVPTPYISTYSKRCAAEREARRRVKDGMRDVTISTIDLDMLPDWELEFRNVRRVCKNLDLRIKDRAYNNSEHEWIFLNEIPKEAVVEVYRFN
ncbi:hypothetical protein MCOR25_010251 [Pyricularia grisea]|uniref:DUF7587 domain-containing protein n=1 Tax=Pyricularia grisea TaxID=148305 RepID=A0A6P8AQK9_PYRGI|nr:uncharacterized protein PgNI_11975 [Pyricularia grisea]KAI6350967.1 hypothetical protein MCOR25_010251 [Pyricularia grisea]TLD04334.1 hypothetical protein PgNI_11975 [Pyricularia grisea]